MTARRGVSENVQQKNYCSANLVCYCIILPLFSSRNAATNIWKTWPKVDMIHNAVPHIFVIFYSTLSPCRRRKGSLKENDETKGQMKMKGIDLYDLFLFCSNYRSNNWYHLAYQHCERERRHRRCVKTKHVKNSEYFRYSCMWINHSLDRCCADTNYSQILPRIMHYFFTLSPPSLLIDLTVVFCLYKGSNQTQWIDQWDLGSQFHTQVKGMVPPGRCPGTPWVLLLLLVLYFCNKSTSFNNNYDK